jgi:hypothetical protein
MALKNIHTLTRRLQQVEQSARGIRLSQWELEARELIGEYPEYSRRMAEVLIRRATRRLKAATGREWTRREVLEKCIEGSRHMGYGDSPSTQVLIELYEAES